MAKRYIDSTEVTQYIEHEAIIDPAPVQHYDIGVETDSEVLGGTQTIHVGVADVSQPRGVLVVPVSWSDYNKRPFQELRLGAMAKFGQLRVVGLDFPGMGDLANGRGDELSERQLEQAREGRFQNLAENYWEAIEKFGWLLSDETGEPLPLSLWGHSLSTLTVAELAASLPDGLVINDFYTSEAMALGETSVPHLARVFPTKGAVDLAHYQEMNTGAPAHENSGVMGLVKQVVRQRQSHLAAVKALSMGRHTDVVFEAYDRGTLSNNPNSVTQHIMVRAENGLVDPNEFEILGMRVSGRNAGLLHAVDSRILRGEAHGYQDSLPALLAQMGHLSIVESH